MAGQKKRWHWAPIDEERSAVLSRKLHISKAVAQILINRGITDEEEGRRFLYGGAELLHDPFALKDMDKAVERIVRAIEQKRKITVYGDYDVDGITATALMMRVLGDLGAEVEYYIPERQSEGYGLNGPALQQLADRGTDLVITVDCGISAAAEVEAIAPKVDIIITDHHQPPSVLPPAYAIITSRQHGCLYPNKNLAGVGVAFKLSQALWKRCRPEEGPFLHYLDIVALGTIADIVPLVEENRILVKLGLAQMGQTTNAGIQALKEVCGLGTGPIDAGKVGYVLAPRLNAAGRVSHGAAGVELLTTTDRSQAAILASALDSSNRARQGIERDILAVAEQQAKQLDQDQEKVIIVSGEGWHSGVIGIVASRLVDIYYRPVIVLSLKDGMAKGSCRSIPAFNMYDALSSAAPLLTQFGGHSQAAGLTMEEGKIKDLQKSLNDFACCHLTADDYIPEIHIDALVRLPEIEPSFMEQIACLEPFGMGNRSPVFACRHLKITDLRRMGQNDQHIRLKVADSQMSLTAVSWNIGVLGDSLNRDSYIDLAFIPEVNEWQGMRTIQLRSRDIHIPGGIVAELDNLYNCYTSLPPTAVGACPALQPSVGPASTGAIELCDGREEEDKLSYISALIRADKKILVIVNHPAQAYAVSAALRDRFPEHAGAVGFFTPLLSAEWQQKITQWFSACLLPVIVTTGDSPFYIDSACFDSIILYDLPYHRDMFISHCALAKERASIHLLFCGADQKTSEENLAACAPDRTTVGQIYLTVKDLASASPVRTTIGQIAGMASARFGIPLSVGQAAAALTILAEIDLITCSSHQGDLTVTLLPLPAQKLELASSPSFCIAHKAKEAFPAFAEGLLTASLGELVSWLEEASAAVHHIEGGANS